VLRYRLLPSKVYKDRCVTRSLTNIGYYRTCDLSDSALLSGSTVLTTIVSPATLPISNYDTPTSIVSISTLPLSALPLPDTIDLALATTTQGVPSLTILQVSETQQPDPSTVNPAPALSVQYNEYNLRMWGVRFYIGKKQSGQAKIGQQDDSTSSTADRKSRKPNSEDVDYRLISFGIDVHHQLSLILGHIDRVIRTQIDKTVAYMDSWEPDRSKAEEWDYSSEKEEVKEDDKRGEKEEMEENEKKDKENK
jgi:hypothetical protein